MSGETKWAESENRRQNRPDPGIGLDCSFVRSWLGILLIAAFFSSVLESIFGSLTPFVFLGGAFVTFTGVMGTAVCGLLILLYLFRIIPRMPGPCGLLMLVYFCCGAAMGLPAYSISVAYSVAIHSMKELGIPAVCSAVFSGLTMILHGVLAFLMFLKWQVLKRHFHRGECGSSIA